jgi:hypothetical protein
VRPKVGGVSGLAVAVLALGVLLLLRQTGVIAEDVRVWPILAIAIGVGMLVATFSGRYSGVGVVVPFVLIDLGVVELLKDNGTLAEDFSIWPSLLVAIGAGAVIGGIRLRRAIKAGSEEPVTFRVPLPPEGRGVTAARLRVRHTAGELRVSAGNDFRSIAVLTYTGGLVQRVERQAEQLVVTLESQFSGGRGGWLPGERRWDLALKPGFPLDLEFETDAGASTIDLTGLLVNSVVLRTGSSATSLALPERGRVGLRIHAAAGSVDVRVPMNLPARIRVDAEAASVRVDHRFAEQEGVYQSPEWDEAADRADIVVEGAAGSFFVG